MNTKQEIQSLVGLAIDLPNVHVSVGFGTVSVTVFGENGEIEWQQNLYEWSHDEAYLPKLRFLRHELERMIDECELPILHKEVA